MIGPVCGTSCHHESCWSIACPYMYQWCPVITVEPMTADLAAAHQASRSLSHGHDPAAVRPGTLVVTERYDGQVSILTSAPECRNGIHAAARAWAEATGAAYDWAAAA